MKQVFLQTVISNLQTTIYKNAGDWAKKNRIYPSDSPSPGPFDISKTPYLNAIFDAIEDPRYKIIVVMMASQLGKTDGLCLNVIGKTLDCNPVPTLFVMPDQKMAETISNDRFNKMLRSTPALWNKLAKGRANKVTEKFISGTRVAFAWASSPSQLCSTPSALVIVDERDRMVDNVADEGDPVEVVKARIKNYANGKILITSTPTIKGASAIEKHYLEGTQAVWSLPCPYCNEYFKPSRDRLGWKEKNGSPYLFFLSCPNCNKEILQEKKEEMLLRGKYIASNPDSQIASFWVSGLCSSWVSWNEIGNVIFRAETSGEINRVQSVVNTFFGEPYEIKGESIQNTVIASLKRPYKTGDIPAGCELLTCGVDVHKNNVHFVIRGWGKNDQSWMIKSGVINGDTLCEPVWRSLGNVVNSRIGELPIRMICIDAGYRDSQVYQFCRMFPFSVPCKGFQNQVSPFRYARINFFAQQKIDKRLVCIDDNYYKTLMFSKMLKKTWFLPDDLSTVYLKHLTAEKMTTDKKGKPIWVAEERDNHFLDCEKLNMVASSLLRVELLDKQEKKTDHGGYEVNPYAVNPYI